MKPKHILFVVAWCLGTHLTTAQQDETIVPTETTINLLDQYYQLNLKVFQANSTQKDIDNIFYLFTDDFTYVHPNYGGVYTRQDLYNGYTRNQKNGGYDGSVVDIKVENKILGLNAIAVSKRFIKKEAGKIVEGEAQMALFEFKEGKIYRVTEFW